MKDPLKQSFFRYENAIVLMMFFTFGIVFMERLSIVFLFPFIGPDLNLTNADLGMIVSVLAVTWALSGWVFSALSDVIGSKRKVLLPATLIFSLCSFLSGMVGNLWSMMFVRGAMGLAEGPVLPIAQATVLAESTPKRRGFNAGFMQSSVGLIGSTLTPIIVVAIATQLSWQWAFYIAGIPGLIMFLLLAKYMREPKNMEAEKGQKRKKITKQEYIEIYKNRNTLLCTLISIVFMTWLFVFTTFAPVYLTSKGYTAGEMGLIMAALGFGSFVWGFGGPAISDKIGRKPTLIIFSLIACLSPLVLALIQGSLAVMMLLGFLTAVGQACFPLFMAIIPGESMPAILAASAISVTQLVGEIFGGAIMPIIAGIAADAWGLEAPLYIAFAGALIAAFIALGIKETAPIKLQKLQVPQPVIAVGAEQNIKQIE
ncbi:MFS transporter [Bacillus sp. FJAT-50079]|uniref:MFS transporter n=1 Tax=Bacillus sp. FJAT-50079 TaxID=2833577 RepID=UPI001BCA0F52|nr:MFS transporter [Bacillus sp. FJAT-50079]MBS4208313.1 MFS transporter [Bacillus sp. FJAT-50079]